MAEEQGLSGENRRLVERFYQERAPEAMSALGTAPFNRLNALLDAARSEGPLPVGGEGGSIRGDEPSSDLLVRDCPAADVVARAICAERCALYGDPPCYTLYGVDWDGGKCENLHDTDCEMLAKVALKAAGQSLNGLAQDGSSHKNDEANPVVRTTPNLPPRAKP